MLQPTRTILPFALLVVLAVLAFGASSAAAVLAPLPDASREFNSPGFVVRHAWVKFAYLATRPFRDERSRADEDALVAEYFTLNRGIGEAERVAGDPGTSDTAAATVLAELEGLRARRADIENSVEVILEGRLTRVARDAGLTRDVGAGIVWPPVNIEFQEPPSVLVRSPRREIRRDSDDLLASDLTLEEAQRIETQAESDGATSALVVRIGGIAMYPAIVPQRADYAASMEDIAHEWLHHYLAFAPLGRVYFEGGEQTTLNETLANIAGSELGRMLEDAYPLPEPPAGATVQNRPANTNLTQEPPVDFTAEMRTLRREVETMLSEGDIEGAEAVMEEKRAYLAENGYYIRRLNQAYFAFHGSYADSPGSIDPIGPKLQRLRDESASLESFVEAAREFTITSDLDAAIAATP